MTGDRLRFDTSDRPMLTDLRRQPPADGLSALRRKLARADASANGFLARAFMPRPSRAMFAAASALAVVALSVGVIHEYRVEQASPDATVARALSNQLRWAEHPLPPGVVDTGTADAFEVDTGNPEIRFYWMLTQERSDDG